MLRPLLALPVLLLTACAAHSGGGHDAAPPEDTATTDAPAPAAPVLRLQVTSLRTTPIGPTTARAITLHFAIANRGDAATPYVHTAKGFSYEPITWVVERDGTRVFAGTVGGLMPGDAAPVTVTLPDEPPGDKTYTVRLDPGSALPLTDRSGTTQSITLTFGGSG